MSKKLKELEIKFGILRKERPNDTINSLTRILNATSEKRVSTTTVSKWSKKIVEKELDKAQVL
jgi:hypothetical protein